MSATHRFSRHFSLRDKTKSSSSKLRSSSTDHNGLFTLDADAKKPSKDEEKKIHELSQNLTRTGRNNVPNARIEYTLRAKGVNGDIHKAWDLLMIFEDSANGLLRPYAPHQKLLGAENRQKVTCWMDSLLFAMFFKTSVFEALLYHAYEDEPRKRLVTVLRLWVNMLRSGKLITTDITKHVQDALADCGWPEAGQVKQQDASEAFVFLTDKLELPLLTLKTDLFHSGSEDNDDHKFITERLLDVAVPEGAPSNGVISLEQCLEEYFNNKVEVKRDLQRQTTLKSAAIDDKATGIHVESVEVNGEDSAPSTPLGSPPSSNIRPLQWRERQTSIFSERTIQTIDGVATANGSGASQSKSRPRGVSVRKEVLMPAWQFLNLIPWYTDQSSNVNSAIKSHFSSKRPMLGICLKRYTVNKDGTPTRLGTKVDIPLEMIPPHFAVGEDEQSESATSPGLKLSLQAVVCHRGQYVTSGHYISLVRAGPRREESHESFGQPSRRPTYDASHDVWFRHDDLSVENKITSVDISAALEREWPYLLFYQVLPLETDEQTDELPPYRESDSFSMVSEKLGALSQHPRPSTEVTDWSRRASVALSEESRGRRGSAGDMCRGAPLESGNSPAIKPEQPSSVGTAATTPGDEAKVDPLAAPPRAPPRSTKSSSRPGSDSSEKVLSRIVSRVSRDKLAKTGTVVVTDEVAVEDGVPGVTRGPNKALPKLASSSKSHDRRSKFMGSMSRHGSVMRRGKDKDIERECSVM